MFYHFKRKWQPIIKVLHKLSYQFTNKYILPDFWLVLHILCLSNLHSQVKQHWEGGGTLTLFLFCWRFSWPGIHDVAYTPSVPSKENNIIHNSYLKCTTGGINTICYNLITNTGFEKIHFVLCYWCRIFGNSVFHIQLMSV